MEHRSPDDLNAAKTTLAGVPGVIQVTLVETPNRAGQPAHLEVVCGPERERVPPRVLRILAECDCGIRDVSRQGDPAHYIVTAV